MALCLVGTQWGYYLGTQLRQFYHGPLVVCGQDPQRTERIARRLDAKWITGYDAALRFAGIRAIILAVPANLHREMGIAALRVGKHVLIEKPLSLDMHGSDALIEAACEMRVVLAAGENIPFRPAIREARRQLGAIGERRLFFASSLHGAVRSGQETGILLDFSVHHIRAVRELFGEPDLVYATAAGPGNADRQVSDNVTLVLSSSTGGWQATLASSWQASAGICPEFILSGTKGALKIWPESTSVDLYPVEPTRKTRIVSMLRPSWLQNVFQSPEWQRRRIRLPRQDRMGYQAELRAFVESIDRGVPDVSSAVQARRDLEIALAAQSSLESGQPVACASHPRLQVA